MTKARRILGADARAFAASVAGSPRKSREVPPMTAAMLARMTISHNAPAIRAPKSGDGSVDVSDGMTGVLSKSDVSPTDNLVFSYSQGDSSGAIAETGTAALSGVDGLSSDRLLVDPESMLQ